MPSFNPPPVFPAEFAILQQACVTEAAFRANTQTISNKLKQDYMQRRGLEKGIGMK